MVSSERDLEAGRVCRGSVAQLLAEIDRPDKPLEYNPGHSSLRLHPLKGKFQGKHAVSLACSYRIVLILTLQNQEIILLDIGSHDAVYR
jgi:mRNA-degrading endonuclease YafQ of YafQ-DinJ toxin-antitoxin module